MNCDDYTCNCKDGEVDVALSSLLSITDMKLHENENERNIINENAKTQYDTLQDYYQETLQWLVKPYQEFVYHIPVWLEWQQKIVYYTQVYLQSINFDDEIEIYKVLDNNRAKILMETQSLLNDILKYDRLIRSIHNKSNRKHKQIYKKRMAKIVSVEWFYYKKAFIMSFKQVCENITYLCENAHKLATMMETK